MPFVRGVASHGIRDGSHVGWLAKLSFHTSAMLDFVISQWLYGTRQG